MKTAEEFLIERNIVIKGATKFPLNLTRDTHMKSKRDIVQAMEDYADYKHSSLSDVRLSILTDDNIYKIANKIGDHFHDATDEEKTLAFGKFYGVKLFARWIRRKISKA